MIIHIDNQNQLIEVLQQTVEVFIEISIKLEIKSLDTKIRQNYFDTPIEVSGSDETPDLSYKRLLNTPDGWQNIECNEGDAF